MAKNIDPYIRLGECFEHPQHGPYTIVQFFGRGKLGVALYRVRFERTGYLSRPLPYRSIKRGNVKDYLARTVHGVGYIGARYKLTKEWERRAKTLWDDIHARSYSTVEHARHPTYIGCSVDPRWQCFLAFLKDLPSVPGFEYWRDNPNQRIALDKDTLVPGNKGYGPGLVCFLSKAANFDAAVSYRKKQVQCIESGRIFESARAAARELNLGSTTVISHCHGRVKAPRFKFVEISHAE